MVLCGCTKRLPGILNKKNTEYEKERQQHFSTFFTPADTIVKGTKDPVPTVSLQSPYL
jgi:hypothetical protein